MHQIPTTILRPAIVVGDSQTGETQKFDGPYYLLKAVSRATATGQPLLHFGRSDSPFNVVPVDYVVEAIATAAAIPETEGETLHLVDPEPLTAAELLTELSARYGGPEPKGSIPPVVGRDAAAPAAGQGALRRHPARVDRLPQPPRGVRHAPLRRPAGRARAHPAPLRRLLGGHGGLLPAARARPRVRAEGGLHDRRRHRRLQRHRRGHRQAPGPRAGRAAGAGGPPRGPPEGAGRGAAGARPPTWRWTSPTTARRSRWPTTSASTTAAGSRCS